MNKGQYIRRKITLGSSAVLAIVTVTGCQPKTELAETESSLPNKVSSFEISSPLPEASSNPTRNFTEVENRGQLAKLSSEQVTQLLEIESTSPNLHIKGLPVIIPSYIPEGFHIDHFHAADKNYNQNPSEHGSYTYYSIGYRSQDNKTCFVIGHVAYDGEYGDGPEAVEKIENINIKALGITSSLGHTSFAQEDSAESIVVKMGGVGPQFYSFYSPSINEESMKADCERNIPLPESVKIIESFQYLDPQITEKLNVTDYITVDGGSHYNPYIGSWTYSGS